MRSFAPLILLLARNALAHDIPADLTVQVLMKPAAERLQLLVRLPLKAVRDVDFPEQRNSYLDLERLTPILPGLAQLWIAQPLAIWEGPRPLDKPTVAATQISLPSDKSFTSFQEALDHVRAAPLANADNVHWNQVLFDVLLEYPILAQDSIFTIRPGFQGLAARVVTALRFLPSTGAVRAFEFVGDPGPFPLDPRWHQAALRFVQLGFRHILDGADHLLFLLCLVTPFRRFRPLIVVVTAFTIAHSFTLIASAYDLGPDALWFPPLIETLIAVSIVWMALENIVGTATARRRWIAAFGFGLVHGFGFSFALRESMQFAGTHLLTSLLSFNIGVELGQILVLLLLIPLLQGLFRFVVAERIGTILLSALVAHTGWHWMTERWEILRKYQFQFPIGNAAFWANTLSWLVLLLTLARAAWMTQRLLSKQRREN